MCLTGAGRGGVIAETDGVALAGVGALGPVSSTGHRKGKGERVLSESGIESGG